MNKCHQCWLILDYDTYAPQHLFYALNKVQGQQTLVRNHRSPY